MAPVAFEEILERGEQRNGVFVFVFVVGSSSDDGGALLAFVAFKSTHRACEVFVRDFYERFFCWPAFSLFSKGLYKEEKNNRVF